MFIFERLIGVGIYAWLLLVIVLLIYYTNISVRQLLAMYVVALCLLAYFYVPYNTADLHRIYATMKSFSSLSFSAFWKTYGVTSSEPLARILYWGIGKTGIYGLLPALNTLICYSCFFYVLKRSAQLIKASRQSIAIALLMFMSIGHFMSVISNIRTMLVIAVIACCMFRESAEKKFSVFHLVLYASTIFIHNIALLLLALRLLCLLIDKHISLYKRTLTLVFAVVGIVIAFQFAPGTIWNDIVKTVENYTTGGYSYTWEYIIGMLIVVAALYIGITDHNACKSGLTVQENRLNEFKSYFWFSMLLAGASFPIFSLFYRLVSGVVSVFSIPFVIEVLEIQTSGYRQRGKQLSPRSAVLVFSILLLLLSCSRGSLCSYKFFVL